MDITQFIARRREALLVGDYNAYRASLSRQLLATRKRLGRATNRRDKFSNKPVSAEDIGNKHEFAYLLLLTSERAWAHAMHIKTSHADSGAAKGITGAARSHIISRLNKATKVTRGLVQSLEDRGSSKASGLDVLEAKAYLASLAGAEEFEKQSEGQRSNDGQAGEKRWQECLEQYATARVIYAALLEKDKKEVYREILANTVDPTIRYAAYQAHLSRTIAVPTVAKKYFPRDDTALVRAVEDLDAYALKDKPVSTTEEEGPVVSQEIPNAISWRGRKANIVDAQIGQALANVTAAEARLRAYLSSNPSVPAKEKASAYDDILITSQDAADATKRAVDELEKERVDEGDRRMQDLRVTSLSVNYDLVSWRVGRNRILIGEDDGMTFTTQHKRKPKRARKDGSEYPEIEEPRGRKLARLRERVVLLDAIIQSINSVKDLRGTMRDATFVSELDAKAAYFRALKCLNVSYSHSLIDNRTNALALIKRAQDLLSATSHVPVTSLPTGTPPTLDISQESATQLREYVDHLLVRTHALVEMHTFESNSRIAASKNLASATPLVQRLNEYPSPGTQVDLKNLVAYPPKIEPVPVKPIFLDIAFNYIDYPGRTASSARGQERPAVNGVEEQPAQRRGWFGFGR